MYSKYLEVPRSVRHFKPDEIKASVDRGMKTFKIGMNVISVYLFKK